MMRPGLLAAALISVAGTAGAKEARCRDDTDAVAEDRSLFDGDIDGDV